jgi:hypothetical protein
VDQVVNSFGGKVTKVSSEGSNRGVTVALDFVYVWGLVLFVAITVWGNRVLAEHNNKNLRTLIGGLFVFTNLTLLCAILSAGLAVSSAASGNNAVRDEFAALTEFAIVFFRLQEMLLSGKSFLHSFLP